MGRLVGELNLIVLHLGNGDSATAVRGGRSVETSMGLSPLEGLVMGTRCGDLDAPRVISPEGTAPAVCVVPTDEELAIAQEVSEVLDGQTQSRTSAASSP